MNYTYTNLLDRVWSRLPEKVKEHRRFEAPTADTFVEGNQTIIKNLPEITDILNRDSKEILKFISRAVAAPIVVQGNRAIIQRSIKSTIVNNALRNYIKTYVMCTACGRPDTRIIEINGNKMIECTACGALYPYIKIK